MNPPTSSCFDCMFFFFFLSFQEMMNKVTGFMRASLVLGQLLGVHVG